MAIIIRATFARIYCVASEQPYSRKNLTDSYCNYPQKLMFPQHQLFCCDHLMKASRRRCLNLVGTHISTLSESKPQALLELSGEMLPAFNQTFTGGFYYDHYF